jgi:hypothetical protein
MMKQLILSAALLGALSTASLAAPDSTLTTDHWLASDVYKPSVYDPSNKKIGDIDDLVIKKDGDRRRWIPRCRPERRGDPLQRSEGRVGQ